MKQIENKSAKIYFLGSKETVPNDNCVHLEDNIYIEHPYKSKDIEIIYGDNPGNIIGLNGENISDIFEYEDKLRRDITSYDRAAASVIVKDNKILSWGVSGNGYHDKHGCERKKRGIVSGQYEICPGCHFDNHSERNAIRMAEERGLKDQLKGATVYLYNHWWACEQCTTKLKSFGIKKVILSRKWTKEFLEIE